jgi:hypothetical protein
VENLQEEACFGLVEPEVRRKSAEPRKWQVQMLTPVS